ncbi:Cobyrinic acid a,c-diamide synthase family protein [gamma proteobacterium HdN1]|nr:Cobyrinic acid a,c-diamide synthase family protein [gamma proteobacterium HdN1]
MSQNLPCERTRSAVRSCPALLVSAPASGHGKTSVTAAIARAYVRRGLRVAMFKTGPDFLDPMITGLAADREACQLSVWMGSETEVRARLYAAAGEVDLILIEGVMGLYDGRPSSADLAVQLGLPVALVIDASAMGGTFGAVAYGLKHYRGDVNVFGAIANRIGREYHAKLVRESLPDDICWMGALPRSPSLALPERHLGLVSAAEIVDLNARLDELADVWERYGEDVTLPVVAFLPAELPTAGAMLAGVCIAIARDDAFCFLYPANLEVLQMAGARIVFFSPLAGDPLPECDACWLPGGYPELHLQTLSQQKSLHATLAAHVDAGKPLLAECGGLLFCLDTLADHQGRCAPMAGLLRGHARLQERLVALGLQAVALPEGELRGHTFHHAQADVEAPCFAMASNPNDAPTREAIYRVKRFTASFVHFYFPSNPQAAARLFLA